MRNYFLFIFLLGASLLANAQDLRHFVLDTVSPTLIKMTGKNEMPWPLPSGSMWHWQKERQLIKNVEEQVFKMAFQDVDWKKMPGLTKIGVFFCFDKTYHIIYVHFFIPKGSLSEEDLLCLEDNFLAYGRLLKEFDLSPYLYTDDPTTFKRGVGRFWLIREKSSVWNEK